ncbi:MAG: PD-(D/E)XK nuclease family protein [Flavobacteriales bacterium]
MSTFLDRLAQALLERHGPRLSEVAVVLPGQRAGMHLRRYLAQHTGHALWSPEVLDMGGWMQRYTGLSQLPTMDGLLLLYEAHREWAGERAEALDSFLQWAPIALRDMSEADAHLLDLDDLYRDLRAYHNIDQWSFTLGKDLSAGQQRALDHWQATGELHRKLGELMAERSLGTSGWIARQAATRDLPVPLPWTCTWFAGLNALDPASTAVIRKLAGAQAAVLAWDGDLYYLNDPKHETGRFLRRSISDLGPGVLAPIDDLRTKERRIRAVMVPDRITQARSAAQELAALDAGTRARTAVVLADEDLLMPLLEALPSDIGPLNVTMGLPTTVLPISALVTLFLDLQVYQEGGAFRVEDVRRLLLHTFIHRGKATQRALEAITALQRSRVRHNVLLGVLKDHGLGTDPNMELALTPVESAMDVPSRIVALLQWVRNLRGHDPLIEEQLFRMARMQHRLDQALERCGALSMDIRAYSRARERLFREERIGFFGEALEGAQVMGFLETRSVELERIILLGANEGTLPRSSTQQSFIPFEVRRAYHLPLRADTEAITAYHTYRLLHGCSDLLAISDQGGATEGDRPSRFIAQWKHELVPCSSTSVTEEHVAVHFATRYSPQLQVHKDAAVMERLNAMAGRGFSPSALGTWLRCPLDLYFTYLLRIQSPDEVDHKLGSDVLGEAVHGVLQELLTPRLGNELDPGEMRLWAERVKTMLVARLAQYFPADVLDRGHFRLRIEMAAAATAEFLRSEADHCAQGTRIVPLALEKELSAVLPDGTRIRGRCDRIERRNGLVHILDIKTGSVPDHGLKLSALERSALDAGQRYALQLLIYAWLYLMEHPAEPSVKAGILPLQKASQAEGTFLRIGHNEVIDRTMLPGLTDLLSELVRELKDPERPFMHDPESRYCTCCAT